MSNALFTKPSFLAFAALLTFTVSSCKKNDVAAPAAPATEVVAPASAAAASEVEELTSFLRSSTGENNVTFDATAQNFVIANDAVMSLDDARGHRASRSGA
ncbi:MAG: hypothetical protein EOO15_20710, partial [Chitinophagaceae bacterium]